MTPLSWRHFSQIALLFLFAGTFSGFAETVAEWQFNPADDLMGGAAVKLDVARAGASAEAVLMEQSSVLKDSTGLGDKWQPYLREGYLDVQGGSGPNSAALHGLATGKEPSDSERNYRAYFGFSGLGTGSTDDGRLQGGTVYLVVNPKGGWGSEGRHGLMGTGHQIDGSVTLQIDEDGSLVLAAGGSKDGKATASTKLEWDPSKWYFIAATWRQSAEPLVYVREMDIAGTATSPEATIVKGEEPAPACGQPDYDPIAIGASWSDPGNVAHTVDGSNARIAYARIDNVYSTPEEIEEVFKSLGAQ